MKNVPGPLLALIFSRQCWVADLYTFTLNDGTVARYCSGDRDITSDGHLFSAGGQTGPYFKREGENSEISWKVGLEVDTLQLVVIPKDGQIGGVDFGIACRVGYFDFADVLVERAFMPTYGDVSAGTLIIFNGLMGEIDPAGRSSINFTINSYTDLLNISMPRNKYQSPCTNTLYDNACALNRATFAVNSAVAAGSSQTSINAVLAAPTGYFDRGSVVFTSGDNNGVSRGIKTYTNGSPSSFSLIPPLPFAVAIADTFTVYPGCDKTMTTCQQKFDNLENFRGYPFIPVPETAV